MQTQDDDLVSGDEPTPEPGIPGGRSAESDLKRAFRSLYTTCPDCSEPYRVGDWPFCESEHNPDGHQKGTYGWVLKG